MVAKTQAPTLMVAGVHDKQVLPARVNELYADIGSREKVFVDLACSSHNAMWEKNHLLLFRSSARMARSGHGQRREAGHAASRLRHQRAACGLGRLSARDPRQ